MQKHRFDPLPIEGKVETAKKMKQKGYPMSDIADMTGLSVEEVEKL